MDKRAAGQTFGCVVVHTEVFYMMSSVLSEFSVTLMQTRRTK